MAHAVGVDRRTLLGYHEILTVLRLADDALAWCATLARTATGSATRLRPCP